MLQDKVRALKNENNGDGRLDMEEIMAVAEKLMLQNNDTDNMEENKENEKDAHDHDNDVWKINNKHSPVDKSEEGDKVIKEESVNWDLMKNSKDNKDETCYRENDKDNNRDNVSNDKKLPCDDEDDKAKHKVEDEKALTDEDDIKPIRIGVPAGYKAPGLRHWTSFKVSGRSVRKMTYSQYRGMLDSYARRRQGETGENTGGRGMLGGN